MLRLTLSFAFTLATATCVAQTAPPPCPTASPAEVKSAQPCATPPPTTPSAKELFPFPEEESRKGAVSAQQQTPAPETPSPASADAPKIAPPAISSSAHDPTDPTPAPIPTPEQPETTLTDEGSSGQTSAAHIKKEKDRVAEDLDVADFYVKKRNLAAAYLRYKDAVEHAPAEPDGHLGLARTAEKLGKRDEAIQHYKLFLTLDPPEDEIKPATRALEFLQAAKP